MAYQKREKPAAEARPGWEVLDPTTGLYARIEGVKREDGMTRMRTSGIPGSLGLVVPDDRVLSFRNKRASKKGAR